MIGPFHFFIVMTVIAVDIVGNWFYIEILKKNPLHWLLWVVRALIVSWVVYHPDLLTWSIRAANAAVLYWFVFDTGLNLARDKGVYHLGKSFLDRLQTKYIGNFYSFVIKGMLALFAAANMLYNYNPYP